MNENIFLFIAMLVHIQRNPFPSRLPTCLPTPLKLGLSPTIGVEVTFCAEGNAAFEFCPSYNQRKSHRQQMCAAVTPTVG